VLAVIAVLSISLFSYVIHAAAVEPTSWTANAGSSNPTVTVEQGGWNGTGGHNGPQSISVTPYNGEVDNTWTAKFDVTAGDLKSYIKPPQTPTSGDQYNIRQDWEREMGLTLVFPSVEGEIFDINIEDKCSVIEWSWYINANLTGTNGLARFTLWGKKIRRTGSGNWAEAVPDTGSEKWQGEKANTLGGDTYTKLDYLFAVNGESSEFMDTINAATGSATSTTVNYKCDWKVKLTHQIVADGGNDPATIEYYSRTQSFKLTGRVLPVTINKQ